MYKKLSKNEKIVTFIIIFSLSVAVIVFKRELDHVKENCRKIQPCNLAKHNTAKISISPKLDEFKPTPGKPNLEYEKTRRRLKQTVFDFSFLIKNELTTLLQELKNNKTQYTVRLSNGVKISTKLLKLYTDFKYTMLNDFSILKKVDGHDEWRLKEVNALSDLVQQRIRTLQAPADCTKAKKMICGLWGKCGFGCELHYMVDCMTASYFSGVPMVLDSTYWHYKKGDGWNAVFQPISSTCEDGAVYNRKQKISEFPGNNSQNMAFGYCNFVKGHAPFMIPNIPHDIYHRLTYVHGDPHIWWIGQIIKHFLRYNPTTVKMLEEMSKSLNLQLPIATIHVRRKDKKFEAPYEPLSKYMEYVDEFYKYIAKTPSNQRKRVFLTTDDPLVVKEARTNYSNYEFYTDPFIGQLKPIDNYAESNFNQTIFNVHYLSRTSEIVCTMTSNLCRLALEIAAFLHPDELPPNYSIDTLWMWPFSKPFYRLVHTAHTAEDSTEIDLEIGDIIHELQIRLNFMDLPEYTGYLKGWNLRTGKFGKYPRFKVSLKSSKMEYPNFKNGSVLFDV